MNVSCCGIGSPRCANAWAPQSTTARTSSRRAIDRIGMLLCMTGPPRATTQPRRSRRSRRSRRERKTPIQLYAWSALRALRVLRVLRGPGFLADTRRCSGGLYILEPVQNAHAHVAHAKHSMTTSFDRRTFLAGLGQVGAAPAAGSWLE